MGSFGWFWLVLLVVLAGFGWFWLVLAGFGWFWLVLAGFGWFHVLVTTMDQYGLVVKERHPRNKQISTPGSELNRLSDG